MIKDGDSVYLDACTNVHEIACALTKGKAITVVTNDFFIASFLMTVPSIDLYHCGGRGNKESHSSAGKYACQMDRGMNFNLAFTSNNSWVAG